MNANKAVIVGGSNGIGLAIAKELIGRGFYAEILDVAEPDPSLQAFDGRFTYHHCNLLEFDEDLLQSIAADPSVNALMITAGFGRVADFEYLHIAEIEKLLEVNTVATIKIIRIFYERIKSDSSFFCGIMGSIAGLISSPMFTVYAASKAAICRFIESINIELELSGTPNRILNVSPGSIRGTRFNGAKSNNSDMTAGLAQDIVEQLLNHRELLIPEYEETYRGVLDRYQRDPHAFGLSSYQYKKDSGRVFNESRVKIGYLCDSFDPLRSEDVAFLAQAKRLCDYLIVGIKQTSEAGSVLPLDERICIVGAVRYVNRAIISVDIADVWKEYSFNRYFVKNAQHSSILSAQEENFLHENNVEIVSLSS